jgi:hypothetical protein
MVLSISCNEEVRRLRWLISTFEKVPFSTLLQKEEEEFKEDRRMQELLTVGIIVLVFAFITVLLIPLMKKMTQNAQLEYELRRDGVTVQGHVIGRYEQVHYRRGGTYIVFKLKYAYLYDGVSYQREADLLESDYQVHPEGTEISVICHPRHPENAYLLIHGRLNGTIPY